MNVSKWIGLYNTGVRHTARPLALKAAARAVCSLLLLHWNSPSKCHLPPPPPLIGISFLEFLVENNLSHSAISNEVSAVKTNLALYGLSSYSFQDPRIAYFERSLSLHKTFFPVVMKIIDIPLLTSIVSICDTMWMGQIFKALYLTAFFSFLRVSNLVSNPLKQNVSPSKQMSRGDGILRYTRHSSFDQVD